MLTSGGVIAANTPKWLAAVRAIFIEFSCDKTANFSREVEPSPSMIVATKTVILRQPKMFSEP